MDTATYPRPVCSKCGMPMKLDQPTGEWQCEVCHGKGTPQRPIQIEPRPDPSRPKGQWLRIIIIVVVLFVLAFLRVFVF